MKDFRYIDNTATLSLEIDKCIGCGNCAIVCPHRIFLVVQKKAEIVDFNACMECGACAENCPVEAISVNPGVGCAAAVIGQWVNKITGRQVVDGCC